MKFIIDRKTFAQALAEVAPFAPLKAPIAILKNAKFTTKGTSLTIEANDRECAMVKTVPLQECDSDGSFLVEISSLNKFIAKTKGDTIEIESNNGIVIIKHSKGKAEFPSPDVRDFPIFNMPEDEKKEIQIATSVLSDAIIKSKGFVATDKIRPVMVAIYAYTKFGDKVGFSASDTHRLIHVWYSAEFPEESNNVDWLIMPAVFNALVNACKSADTVKVQVFGKHVAYQFGDTLIQTVQANGKFPDFERVIPKEWVMECAVDKFDLTDALERLALFCDSTESVKIDLSRLDMTLSVDNIEYMKKSIETLTHNGCSGEIKIGVNVGNLLAAVSVFGGGDILMKISSESRPILFTQQDKDNLQVIAMPLQIVNQ